MGSRRKKKADRLTAGAAGVARQARENNPADPVLARSEQRASSGRGALAPASAPPPIPPSSASAHPGSDASKHARVGLVTKQTDDGSYELVYEAIDEEQEELQAPPPPTPPWKRKPVLIGGAVAGALLTVGVGGLIIANSGDDKPRKVTEGTDQPASADPNARSEKPRYEYVAPSTNEGRIDLDQDDKGAASPTPRTAGSPPPTLRAPNIPPVEDSQEPGNANPAPSINPQNLDQLPKLDLKPTIPNIQPSFKQPLDPRTQELLNKRLTNDPTGAPDDEGDEGDEEILDEGDDEGGEVVDDSGDENLDEEGDDEPQDNEEGDENDEGDDEPQDNEEEGEF